MIYYTGVGARETPDNILDKMLSYGTAFAKSGFTLRSGGAKGADSAFEIGAINGGGGREIYLPWKNINGNPSSHFNVSEEAFEIAEKVYGRRWDSLSIGVQSMMGRNIHQVLGENVDTPSSFVLCWTPDGAITHLDRSRATGGTGQTIACASLYDIPVFNLYNTRDEDLLLDFVAGLK